MDLIKLQPERGCHVVAVPYPGRGHVNPMMNICKLLASKNHAILITFVVTEEWLGFIAGDTKSTNIRFASIPNVLPSELTRGVDFPGFYEAVMTKMEDPFVDLLDRLEQPVTAIIADTELLWAIRVGNERSIPVATLCTVSASVFSTFHYFDHIHDVQTLVDIIDRGDETQDHKEGISSRHIADLRAIFHGEERRVMQLTLECISLVPKAQYLLVNSVYELESQIFNTLKAKFAIPIYSIGPAIPYFEIDGNHSTTSPDGSNYFKWLDSQPTSSVLYVSLGSFLSISSYQMDEIAAGLRDSGVPYLWVARGETARLKEGCSDKGIIVPWCDQLKVLCHSSVGGFWTHCGWNSTLEAVFSGTAMLTFPLFFDQVPNSKQVVENWRIGWKVKENTVAEKLMKRSEIAEVVKKFMDTENSEGKEMRRRVKELQETCKQAIAEGGSSDRNFDAFIEEIKRN